MFSTVEPQLHMFRAPFCAPSTWMSQSSRRILSGDMQILSSHEQTCSLCNLPHRDTDPGTSGTTGPVVPTHEKNKKILHLAHSWCPEQGALDSNLCCASVLTRREPKGPYFHHDSVAMVFSQAKQCLLVNFSD